MKKYREEPVDLIASGYEWACPVCDHFNKEIEITEIVCCANCKQPFETNPAEHAYG